MSTRDSTSPAARTEQGIGLSTNAGPVTSGRDAAVICERFVDPVSIAEDRGRFVFVDLARAITVLMMLQGHSLHVLLAPSYSQGMLFDAWHFMRGLTAPMFLLLSGFSFSVATMKHWETHLFSAATIRRRLQRFSFFLMLGYAIHVPSGILTKLVSPGVTTSIHFLKIDVLQLIAASLILLQGIVWLTRSPARFSRVCAVLALAIVLATPLIRPVEWARIIWPPLAAYLYSGTGSLFPLFGWAAYVFMGASLGAWFVFDRPENNNRISMRFVWIGGAALLIALVFQATEQHAYYPIPRITESRPDFLLIRLGGAMFLLAGFVQLTRWVRRLGPLRAIAEESLIVYVVHLCVLYGSIWSVGLRTIIGRTLSPGPTLLIIVALMGSMGFVAYYWNRFKRNNPRGKQWAQLALTAVLIVPFI